MSERTNPCEFCDTEQLQQKKQVTVTRQRQGQCFIFESVPAWVCPHCGHRYFDADVPAAIEERMNAAPEDVHSINACAISLAQPAS